MIEKSDVVATATKIILIGLSDAPHVAKSTLRERTTRLGNVVFATIGLRKSRSYLVDTCLLAGNARRQRLLEQHALFVDKISLTRSGRTRANRRN